MVDVEADGPCPGLYSMVSFGAVAITPELDKTFYGQLRPISENYVEEALKVSGFTRENTLSFREPTPVMEEFTKWLVDVSDGNRVFFISDNNGFDWQFINYYFHACCGRNPFGHSSTNLGSLYKGMEKNTFKNFKHLRRTRHTHNPVDDARGNAEAFLEMVQRGLRVKM